MTRVLVAMSGGVDSSVAAALLKREGYDLHGVFMRNGIAQPRAREGEPGPRKPCSREEDAVAARAVAEELGIPFTTCDLSAEFGSLIASFVEQYRAGCTPNPCVICNRDHKFGRLLALADELGMERLATGHYARLDRRESRPRLLRGRDGGKEQSYVLSLIPEGALARALFPLGEREKSAVREMARELGLSSSETPESQEICFVPSGDYRDLLRAHDVPLRPGRLVDSGGRVRGEHAGIENFTVGQRRGLGIAASEPLYVLEIRAARAEVVVGTRAELGRRSFSIAGMNWIGRDPLNAGERLRCSIQIRAHHRAREGMVEAREDGALRARFDEPVDAITPGQCAAIYSGEQCLGGGIIGLE